MYQQSEFADSHGDLHYELDLRRLPPSTHVFPYRGSAAFLETYYRERDRFCRDQSVPDFVVLAEVDEKKFDEDFRSSSDKVILHSISTYDPTQRVLFAKMTTAEHAQALEEFGDQLLAAIQPQNLCEMVGKYAGHLFDGQGRCKVAGKAWGPRDRTPHQNERWPTIVMEVAVSETRMKLEADISFWLTRTFGQVKMVIAAEVARTRHQRILLEKWVLDDKGQPHCPQRITLRKTSLQDRTPVIENGPLTIEFDTLFLRPRQPGEHDVVLDNARLRIIGENLWIVTEIEGDGHPINEIVTGDMLKR